MLHNVGMGAKHVTHTYSRWTKPPKPTDRHVGEVLDALDWSRLRKRCVDSLRFTLHDLGGEVSGVPGQQYAYKQVKGARILAVAHCDTVQKKPKWREGGTVIQCRTLDDRLGVYTVMDLLPLLGIKADVLLTEGEETGKSTAALFKTDKSYNWIAEFDRRGEDVVTYQYEWGEALTGYFGSPARGAYSDICKLEDLGCKALNLGIGYDHEHSKHAHMYVYEYIRQLARFVAFYEEVAGKWFPHEKKVRYVVNPSPWMSGMVWDQPTKTWVSKFEADLRKEERERYKEKKQVCGFPVKDSGKGVYHADWLEKERVKEAARRRDVPDPDEGAREYWTGIAMNCYGVVPSTGELLFEDEEEPKLTSQAVIEQDLLDRTKRRAAGKMDLLEGDEEIATCTGCEILLYLSECTMRSLGGELCPVCGHVVTPLLV